MNSKVFLQYAWVGEVIALIAITAIAFFTVPIDKFIEWVKVLPILGGFVVAQGGAASIGPLVKSKIDQNSGGKDGQ